MNKKLSSSSVAEIEKRERLKRAKNKIQLMRRQVNDKKANKHRLLALVREYVSQRPEVTIQVIQKWINQKP
jgi:flagellar biosynthesis/type III secretory pathway M-ring protein FliF/YscJ